MKTRNKILLTFVFTLVYAIIRYNLMGNVPFTDIPAFILNKAISFSLIVLLLLIVIGKNSSGKDDIKLLIKFFNFFLVCHILLSTGLLTQAYYPKLFTEGKFNLLGNLAILSGVVGVGYIFVAGKDIKNSLIAILAASHLFFIGAKGWLTVDKWHGFMPPITLLCFILSIVVLVYSLYSDKRQ